MISSFVITGFLGVGKTTMLTNSIKQHFPDKKVAIIVNEFGDIGVDSTILKNVHSEVLEISEGCICCQLAEEFESGVQEIVEKYDPEILFVETSGASEPFPIYYSLNTLGITVEGIICIIDSKNYKTYMDEDIFKYQIGGSNILVLNKSDLVNEKEQEILEHDIGLIKGKYNIKNTMTGVPIFKNHFFVRTSHGELSREIFEDISLGEIVNLDDVEQAAQSNNALISKTIYIKDTTFDILDKFITTLPGNIYRAKGIVKLSDIEDTMIANSSFGDVQYDKYEGEIKNSFLVLIGKDIDKTIVELENNFNFINIPKFTLKA
ncbi:MAG: GTP-binding protein [Sulfurovum sp.]|nr:GTP-binding protein [Sulfurovum sp.]